jgi:DnaA family protein
MSDQPRVPSPQLALDFQWDRAADFDGLVAGPNEEAVAAARTAAIQPGVSLHFHGPGGTGKSHLLQAMCGVASARGAAAVYLPLAAMRNYPPSVLAGLEAVALVALDDVDAMAGQTAWEEALFDLYNRLRDAGVRLVTAAAQPPESLGLALPDLVSRLQAGVLYGLRPLSDADRLTALQRRAARRGLALPDASARYLVERFPRDTAGLFERLDLLDEASLRSRRRLTIPFIREVLGAPASDAGRR